jgi:hypothetical protein
MKTNYEVLRDLMNEGCKSGADPDGPYMKLLAITLDMETRLKVLENNPIPVDRAPFSSLLPCNLTSPFLTINEKREEMGLPPLPPQVKEKMNTGEEVIYEYLVQKGYPKNDSAAIAKEIERNTDEQ